jgi:hypothetical protein
MYALLDFPCVVSTSRHMIDISSTRKIGEVHDGRGIACAVRKSYACLHRRFWSFPKSEWSSSLRRLGRRCRRPTQSDCFSRRSGARQSRRSPRPRREAPHQVHPYLEWCDAHSLSCPRLLQLNIERLKIVGSDLAVGPCLQFVDGDPVRPHLSAPDPTDGDARDADGGRDCIVIEISRGHIVGKMCHTSLCTPDVQ